MKRRKWRKKTLEYSMDFWSKRSSGEFCFIRNQAAGHYVVRIQFVKRDGDTIGYLFFPLALDPQVTKVGHDRSSFYRRCECNDAAVGRSGAQEERDLKLFQKVFNPLKACEHKIILPQSGIQKIGGQTKQNAKRRGSFKRKLLCKEQRPIIRYALIAAHPVDDRTFALRCVFQQIDTTRINRRRYTGERGIRSGGKAFSFCLFAFHAYSATR